MLLAGLCALLALNTASAAQELSQRALTDSNASASDIEQQLVRDLAAKQAPAALASAAAGAGTGAQSESGVPADQRRRLGDRARLADAGLAPGTAEHAHPEPQPGQLGRPVADQHARTVHRRRSADRGAVTVTVTRTAPASPSTRPSPHPTVTSSAPGRHR